MDVNIKALINEGVIIFLAVALVSCEKSKNETEQLESAAPNILFIYTDDQAPWGAGYTGNTQAITPNIDALATQGMIFPNAYTTTPVCSPSRAGLLTSRYGFELGIDDWINTEYQPFEFTQITPELGLSTEFQTWPKLLRTAGYYTGLIGKWHLGIGDNHHPTQHGYDEFTGFREGGVTTIDPRLEKEGKPQQYQGLTADVLTQEAISFLQTHRTKKFALSLHYRAPHTNWLPVAKEDAAPYDNMEIKLPQPNYPDLNVNKAKSMMRDYLSSIGSIDRNVGRLMSELDRLGLTENTFVVFTSDHGYNMGHNGIWHKGNGHWLLNNDTKPTTNIPVNQRPNMYDNSIKVPAIVRWPSQIEANSVSYSTLSNLDWFPTLLAVAKAQKPESLVVRGVNHLPVFLGDVEVLSDNYYAAYSTLHQSVSAMRMYSDGRYKLIKDYKNRGRDEFYDLQHDANETYNLIKTNRPELQQIINRFDDVIFKKMLATNDPELAQFFGEKK